tara:strand:- start:3351 stop:3614 length:264 start_codon:yes stop_codon:yes gene_type:complete
MTEFSETVERQRLLLEAEEWAEGINQIHVFDAKTTHMWYEENPDDGRVTDTTYNDGRIERTKDGKLIRTLGNKLEGDDLIDKYVKFN